MVRVLTTTSPEETEKVGAAIAGDLRPGDVVLVAGELGSGKTTLVRGACRALGIAAGVTSPTFTIGQRYRPAPAGGNATGVASGVALVSHLDLYRVADLDDEDPDLLADYLRPDAVAFVEWPPESVDPFAALGRVVMRVRLEHAGGDARTITIEPAA
jgi:tRNA threonylcarbamoyladenosine biosynthesis protein TsaE